MLRRWIIGLLVWTGVVLPAAAQNPPPVPHPHPLRELSLITFGGAQNLPFWAAQRQGFLADEGLDIHFFYTPNSVYEMTQMLAGTFDLGMAAFDNVVAYEEGQNEAPIGPNPDLVTVAWTDNSFLTLVSQGPLKTVESLRGHVLTVDAMTTGYAFVLRDILEHAGIGADQVSFISTGGTPNRYRAMLEHPEQAATIQGTPFEFIGEAHGLNTLMRLDRDWGPYPGSSLMVRRSWAATHHDEVVGVIRALIRGTDWLYDRASRPIAEALLVADIPGMTPELARKTYDVVLGDKGGIFRDAMPDMAAIQKVLVLRSKYGMPHRDLTDPTRYMDMSFRAEALAHPKGQP